ncbi:MAG: hypothetical protein AAF494_01035 [Pseudomonadota bacterium]
MNALFAALVAFALLVSLSGAAVISWPGLPGSGFLSRRVATPADVEAGNAVFSKEGVSERPLDIAIPQYALWTDEKGEKQPVILLQAERLPDGRALFGAPTLGGVRVAGFTAELELLGPEMPQSE